MKEPTSLSTLLSHLFMHLYNVELQTVKLEARWPVRKPASRFAHSLQTTSLVAEFDCNIFLKPIGLIVLISVGMRQRYKWKCRFYSNAFMNIWALSWPCHRGLLIVLSLFQMNDPSLLHITSDNSKDCCGTEWLMYINRKSPMNHEHKGMTLCTFHRCVSLLWNCMP